MRPDLVLPTLSPDDFPKRSHANVRSDFIMSKNWRISELVSAPDGTNDALILRDIEDQIGSYAESLTSEDKLAFLAVLSRYLYFKQWVVPDYSVGEGIAPRCGKKSAMTHQQVSLCLAFRHFD